MTIKTAEAKAECGGCGKKMSCCDTCGTRLCGKCDDVCRDADAGVIQCGQDDGACMDRYRAQMDAWRAERARASLPFSTEVL